METFATPLLLAEKFRKLLYKRNFVLSRVEKAKEKNEKIHGDVTKWLEEVDKVIEEMNRGKKKGVTAPPTGNYFSSMKVASEELLKALQDDKNHVIGLYGKRGAGKTTLVKSEINKYEKMFCRVIYLDMLKKAIGSMYGEIANSLNVQFKFEEDNYNLEEVYFTDPKRKEKIESEIDREDVTTLVILDNFPTQYSLKDIGIPDGCTQCKVLLIIDDEADCTEHYKKITQRKKDCDYSIPLEAISDDEAWELLQNLKRIDSGSDLFDVAREVASGCKGLPGLIKDVVSSLENKNTIEYWTETLDNLRDSTASHQIYLSQSTFYSQIREPLRDALVQEGFGIIITLHSKKDNPEAFDKAIEQSKCSIILISEGFQYHFKYFQELTKILKCKEETKQLVVPIFYKIDPSGVRDLSGKLGFALNDVITEMEETYEEEDMIKEEDMKKEWTSALYEIGSLPDVKQYTKGTLSKFIKEIVEYLKNNRHRLHVKHANGQEGRFCSHNKNCKGDS